MFDNWGLFDLREHTEVGIAEFWERVQGECQKLPKGVGVYLVFAMEADGRYLPVYIGQTYQSGGFEKRFREGHFKHRKFAELMRNGPVKICFLALAKKGQPTPVRSEAKGRRDKKLIDWLEISLIEWCLKLNENLMNIKHARFADQLWVAGYHGSESAFTDEPAYAELAQLLHRR